MNENIVVSHDDRLQSRNIIYLKIRQSSTNCRNSPTPMDKQILRRPNSFRPLQVKLLFSAGWYIKWRYYWVFGNKKGPLENTLMFEDTIDDEE